MNLTVYASDPGPAVALSVRGGVAEITLNRPDRLNAFDESMAVAWRSTVSEAVQHPDVRAIIIAGAGRAFCAGGDVRAMAEMTDLGTQITALAQQINAGLLALLESEIPVVAAAHGTTAGGGLGVLLSSDYAVVGESSKIGSRYAAIGLTPDLSVSALFARAVGERRALQLALSERMLSAAEAQQWGLVAEVVADDQVLQRAREIAAHWAGEAPEAYGQTKRLIRSQPTRTLEDQLEREAQLIGEMAVTPVASARISAFAQRGSGKS